MTFDAVNAAVNAAVERAFLWALAGSVHASVLILLAWTLRRLVGDRLSPRFWVAVGFAVMARLLLPTDIGSPWSVHNLWMRSDLAPVVSTPASPSLNPAGEILRVDAMALARADSLISDGSNSVRLAWMARAWLGVAAFLMSRRWLQHRRVAREIAALEAPDARFLQAMDDCRAELGLKRRIRIGLSDSFKAPAVFGSFAPTVVAPRSACVEMDDERLRMVLLHELAHVKRHDLALNWGIALVGAIHWFNPAVGWAIGRLREDRELVCDRLVLSRLEPDQRRTYGHTLLHFSEALSGEAPPADAVSIVGHRKSIKRRITMITKFQPATARATLIGTTLFAWLCLATFTSAKEAPPPADAFEDAPNRDARVVPLAEKRVPLETFGPRDAERRSLESLERAIARAQSDIRLHQETVDRMRDEWDIPNRVAYGSRSDIGDAERNQAAQRTLIEMTREQIGHTTLIKALERMSPNERRRALPTAAPDEILKRLMSDLARAKQTMISEALAKGENHPDMQRLRALVEEIDKQIDERCEGIMEGLKIRLAAMERQTAHLEDVLARRRKEERDLGRKLNPYFEQLRQLKVKARLLEVLELRLAQEKMDASLPPGRKLFGLSRDLIDVTLPD